MEDRLAVWKRIELLNSRETRRERSRKWDFLLKLTVDDQRGDKQRNVQNGLGQSRFQNHVHEKQSGQNCSATK